jgi:hypothetical protein
VGYVPGFAGAHSQGATLDDGHRVTDVWAVRTPVWPLFPDVAREEAIRRCAPE